MHFAGADGSGNAAAGLWRDQVRVAQVDALLQDSGATRYVPFFVLLTVVLLHLDAAPAWMGLLLLAVYVLVKLVQEGLLKAYRRATPTADGALRWARRFAGLSLLTGSVWGLAGALYYELGDPRQQALLILLIFGMVLANALTRSSYLPAFYAFMVTASLPLVVILALQADARSWVTVGVMAVYLAALSMWVRQLQRRELHSLELAFMNASLREALETSREEALSDRDQARDNLARSALSLENAQRLACLGSWDFAPQVGALFWSEHLCRLLEYPPDSVPTFAAMLERVHPGDRDRVTRAHRRASRNGEPFQLDYRLVTPDAGMRYVVERCDVETDANGASQRVSSVVQDVTDQRLVEIAMQRGQEYLRTLLESVSDVIAIVTREGELTFTNRAVEAVLGYSAEAVLGRNVLDLIHPEDRDRVSGALASAGLPGDPSMPKVLRVRGRDGRYRDIEIIGRDLSDNPLVGGTVVLARDIGARRQAERELRSAKEQAEFANLAKSNFLANISHELRTPLNAILGFSELIESEVMGPIGNEQYREYLSDIRRSGAHLLGLINDILDLSRIEAGEETLIEQELDLRRVLEGCVRLLASRREQAGIAIHLDMEQDTPMLWVDRRKFNQIIINLLSNALKFTPAGGTITVHYRPCADGGIAISVIDTGIGMRAQDIPMAMRAFSQIDNSDSRSFEGAGLGLPICRALVELHGGRFSIESEPGRGTTVTFSLPPDRVHRPVAGHGLDEVVAAVKQSSKAEC